MIKMTFGLAAKIEGASSKKIAVGKNVLFNRITYSYLVCSWFARVA